MSQMTPAPASLHTQAAPTQTFQNHIPQRQNEPKFLRLLAAQRQMYSDAKGLQLINFVLAVIVPVLWSIAALFVPTLKTWGALWGAVATILNEFVITPRQRVIRNDAASVQQLIDIELMDMPGAPNPGDVTLEDISAYAAKYEAQHKDPVRDWYCIQAGMLPLHLGRIVCQRSNINYDRTLRRRYARWMLWLTLSVPTLLVALNVLISQNFEGFVLSIVIALPAIVFGSQQFHQNSETAKTAHDRLKAASALWDKALADPFDEGALTSGSYDLQSLIYEYRRTSPFIPDWVYRRLHDKQEQEMNRDCETLAGQMIERLAQLGAGGKTQANPHR